MLHIVQAVFVSCSLMHYKPKLKIAGSQVGYYIQTTFTSTALVHTASGIVHGSCEVSPNCTVSPFSNFFFLACTLQPVGSPLPSSPRVFSAFTRVAPALREGY